MPPRTSEQLLPRSMDQLPPRTAESMSPRTAEQLLPRSMDQLPPRTVESMPPRSAEQLLLPGAAAVPAVGELSPADQEQLSYEGGPYSMPYYESGASLMAQQQYAAQITELEALATEYVQRNHDLESVLASMKSAEEKQLEEIEVLRSRLLLADHAGPHDPESSKDEADRQLRIDELEGRSAEMQLALEGAAVAAERQNVIQQDLEKLLEESEASNRALEMEVEQLRHAASSAAEAERAQREAAAAEASGLRIEALEEEQHAMKLAQSELVERADLLASRNSQLEAEILALKQEHVHVADLEEEARAAADEQGSRAARLEKELDAVKLDAEVQAVEARAVAEEHLRRSAELEELLRVQAVEVELLRQERAQAFEHQEEAQSIAEQSAGRSRELEAEAMGLREERDRALAAESEAVRLGEQQARRLQELEAQAEAEGQGRARAQQLEGEVRALHEERGRWAEAEAEARSAKEGHASQMSALEAALADVDSGRQQGLAHIAELERVLAEAGQRNEELEARLAAQQGDQELLARGAKRIEELEAQVAKDRQCKQEFEELLARGAARIEELEGQVAQGQQCKQELEKEVAQRERRSQELEGLLGAAEDRGRQLDDLAEEGLTRTRELERLLVQRGEELEELRAMAAARAEELKEQVGHARQEQSGHLQLELDKLAIEHSRRSKELEDQVSIHVRRTSELEAELRRSRQTEEDQLARIAQLEQAIGSQDARQARQLAEFSAVSQQMSELEEVIGKVRRMERDLASQNTTVAELSDRVNEQARGRSNGEAALLSGEMVRLGCAVEELRDQLGERGLRGRLDEEMSRLSALSATVAELSAQVAAATPQPLSRPISPIPSDVSRVIASGRSVPARMSSAVIAGGRRFPSPSAAAAGSPPDVPRALAGARRIPSPGAEAAGGMPARNGSAPRLGAAAAPVVTFGPGPSEWLSSQAGTVARPAAEAAARQLPEPRAEERALRSPPPSTAGRPLRSPAAAAPGAPPERAASPVVTTTTVGPLRMRFPHAQAQAAPVAAARTRSRSASPMPGGRPAVHAAGVPASGSAAGRPVPFIFNKGSGPQAGKELQTQVAHAAQTPPRMAWPPPHAGLSAQVPVLRTVTAPVLAAQPALQIARGSTWTAGPAGTADGPEALQVAPGSPPGGIAGTRLAQTAAAASARLSQTVAGAQEPFSVDIHTAPDMVPSAGDPAAGLAATMAGLMTEWRAEDGAAAAPRAAVAQPPTIY
ncbi:unnamed protein product [Prorocentrum cordatum]|nr:unnamed protein product [Polarella glacialis]